MSSDFVVSSMELDDWMPLIEGRQVTCLVDGDRFNSSSKPGDTFQDIFENVGIVLNNEAKEILVYSSKELLKKGFSHIQGSSLYKKNQLMPLDIPLGALLDEAIYLKGPTIVVNPGLEQKFFLKGEQISQVKHLAMLYLLCQQPKFYVLQDSQGVAMCLRKNGLQRVVAYLSQSQAESMLEDLSSGKGHLSLEVHRSRDLVNQLVEAKLDGMVIDYKLDSKIRLEKRDLERMQRLFERMPGVVSKVKNKLFKR